MRKKKCKTSEDSGRKYLFHKINLLSKDIQLQVLKIFFPVVLYGYETWSLTMREERRVPRKIFGPKRDEGSGENCIMSSFMTCTAHQILFGR